MAAIRFSFIVIFAFIGVGCLNPSAQTGNSPTPANNSAAKPVVIADSFAYPIGNKEVFTQMKDKDEWYNALDFGASDHLGEDWNKNTGGNTDCGEPIYAAADGVVTYAADAGPGWGNVVIVEHTLASGEKVQSLYGHMQELLRNDGSVKKREQIGKIGNANGRYLCHLHFEIRTPDCPMWNQAGGGYSPERKGWIDPSDFIDEQRRKQAR